MKRSPNVEKLVNEPIRPELSHWVRFIWHEVLRGITTSPERILVYVRGIPRSCWSWLIHLVGEKQDGPKFFVQGNNVMAWNQTHRSDRPLRLKLTLCASFTLHYHLITFRLQITNWLQGLFIFAMVWSIGGTINGDSRKKFDAFFRLLISGTDKDHPKPNNIKMTKVKKCC